MSPRRRCLSIKARFRLKARPVWRTDTSHHFDGYLFALGI